MVQIINVAVLNVLTISKWTADSVGFMAVICLTIYFGIHSLEFLYKKVFSNVIRIQFSVFNAASQRSTGNVAFWVNIL